MKIVLDAMGGDNAPEAILAGAVAAEAEYDDIDIVIAGDEPLIRAKLEELGASPERFEILPSSQTISMNEDGARAPLIKKDASMVRALMYVADKPDAMMISAGNTGALVTGAVLYIKRIPGIKRPALAPMIPTRTGQVVLIDAGANAECKPTFLAQFGLMGSIYMRRALGIEEPRVALINNGEEPEKGTPLTRDAYKLLKKMPIRFVGNVEGRDLLSGRYDVLVTDGFTGNVVLKFVEGCSRTILGMLKEYISASFSARLGAVFMKDAFSRLKRKMDYKEHGGALLLGVNSGVMKAHGSSDARAVQAAIGAARDFISGGVVQDIREEIARLEQAAREKAARKEAEKQEGAQSAGKKGARRQPRSEDGHEIQDNA